MGEVLERIVNAIQTISDMNAHIACAAEEQTAVSDEISRNVSAIADVLEQTASGAQLTAENGAKLSDLAAKMGSMTVGFNTH